MEARKPDEPPISAALWVAVEAVRLPLFDQPSANPAALTEAVDCVERLHWHVPGWRDEWEKKMELERKP
jgi:hypothetical protein